MAGRAAEDLIFGEVSTGAADDLGGLLRSHGGRKFDRRGRRFRLDWRFGLTRDGAQTSMMCGTISGRLPSAWLK